MNKYLVVQDHDGLVLNAITWDGVAPLAISGCSLIPVPDTPEGVWIGWSCVNDQWVSPVLPEEDK